VGPEPQQQPCVPPPPGDAGPTRGRGLPSGALFSGGARSRGEVFSRAGRDRLERRPARRGGAEASPPFCRASWDLWSDGPLRGWRGGLKPPRCSLRPSPRSRRPPNHPGKALAVGGRGEGGGADILMGSAARSLRVIPLRLTHRVKSRIEG